MNKKSAKNGVGKSQKSKADRAISHEWIKERGKAIKKTGKEIAAGVGIRPSRLSEKIKGKMDFEPKEIPALARELQLPFNLVFARLTGLGNEDMPDNIMLLEVRGEANAGHWSKAPEWPPNVWEYIMVPNDAEYSSAVYGLRVTGDDMDKVYPPGQSTVTCMPYVYYKDKIYDGEHVVVQRDDGNGQYETTIKQVSIKKNHIMLCPNSDNPAYKAIELLETDEAEEYYGTQGLKIVGVVLGAVTVIDMPTLKGTKDRKSLPISL